MPALAKSSRAVALKEHYGIGEIPPLGHVPPQMHAWAIRKERHGPPESSMQLELLPTWEVGQDEVLVYVRAERGADKRGVAARGGLRSAARARQTSRATRDTRGSAVT